MADEKKYIEVEAAKVGMVVTSLVGRDLDDVMHAIDLVPAADVRPVVRGRWELTHRVEGAGEIGCTACGWATYGRLRRDGSYYMINFCPNCGADMREADNGT